MNWYKLTLLDEEAEKIITMALLIVVIIGFLILIACTVGGSLFEEMGGEFLNDSTSSSQ